MSKQNLGDFIIFYFLPNLFFVPLTTGLVCNSVSLLRDYISWNPIFLMRYFIPSLYLYLHLRIHGLFFLFYIKFWFKEQKILISSEFKGKKTIEKWIRMKKITFSMEHPLSERKKSPVGKRKRSQKPPVSCELSHLGNKRYLLACGCLFFIFLTFCLFPGNLRQIERKMSGLGIMGIFYFSEERLKKFILVVFNNMLSFTGGFLFLVNDRTRFFDII